MNTESTLQSHIAVTEALVRFYMLLTQHLDRTQYESARAAYPEHMLQEQLSSSRVQVMDLLSVNRVVQHKVEHECAQVLSMAAGTVAVADELKAARTVLKAKILALSDLLAVFRA